MALPASGVLSFSTIATELATAPPFSLRSMSSIAGKSTPDAVSEFYGYGAVTYTYYATWALDDPCGDYYDIYTGSDSKYYVDGSGYELMYAFTEGSTWYEYLYYDPWFDANVYNGWTIDATSATLTDEGLFLSEC